MPLKKTLKLMRQLINLWNRQFLDRSFYFVNRTHEETKIPPTMRAQGSLGECFERKIGMPCGQNHKPQLSIALQGAGALLTNSSPST